MVVPRTTFVYCTLSFLYNIFLGSRNPYHPIYPKGFRTNLLKLPIHLQEKIFEKIWNNGEGFNGIIINNSYPRLRVDLRFMFLLYSQHKAKIFPANKFGYGCWNGGTFTKSEARFHYGPFDPCTSVWTFRISPILPLKAKNLSTLTICAWMGENGLWGLIDKVNDVLLWTYAISILEPAHTKSHPQNTSVWKVANDKAREDRAIARDYKKKKKKKNFERRKSWLRSIINLHRENPWYWTKLRESITWWKEKSKGKFITS